MDLKSKMQSLVRSERIREWLIPVALLLPLVVMAAYEPTFLEMKAHAFDMLQVARNIASGSIYTHACIQLNSWSLIWYGGIMEYALAPFVRIAPNVLTMYAVGVVLAVLAGVLFYKLCVEFFSKPTAYVATWMYATMAFVPNQLRRLILQEYLFFFIVLGLYSVFKMKFKNELKYFFLFCVSVAFCLQLHISTIPILILIFFIPWKQLWKQKRSLLAGILVLLVLFLPYLAYLYEDRVWVGERIRTNLGGIAQGGEESLVGSRADTSLFDLRRHVFDPVLDILKCATCYGQGSEGPLLTRLGIHLYTAVVFIGLALGIIGTALSLISPSAVKRIGFERDMKHIILLVVWIASLLWIALFPYHVSHHLIILLFPSLIFTGVAFSWALSHMHSRILKILAVSLVVCVGLASIVTFIVTLRTYTSMGYSPTTSGLSYARESALSEYIAVHNPQLTGNRILILDQDESYHLPSHQFLSGPRNPAGGLPDSEWRKMFGCGPRTQFSESLQSSWLFLDAGNIGQKDPGGSNVQYILVHSGRPVKALEQHFSYLAEQSLSLAEFDKMNSGRATISLCADGSSWGSPPEQYPQELPRSFVTIDNFPPLNSGSSITSDPCMVYRYHFSVSDEARTLIFLDGLNHEGYSMHYTLNGESVSPTEVFLRASVFSLVLDSGGHVLEVEFRPDDDVFRNPFQSFDLYFFDLAD